MSWAHATDGMTLRPGRAGGDNASALARRGRKSARLRALRLARDAANQKAPPANRKGVA
jgi:hypothetical protein